MNLVGDAEGRSSARQRERGRWIARRRARILRPHPALPDDTRLWAALVQASGGVWGGCVYDAEKIVRALESGAPRD